MKSPDEPVEQDASWSRGGENRDLDERIKQFEQAWFDGEHPRIEHYLGNGSDDSLPLLLELVHADLEFRLRAAEPARVEDYLKQFPLLAATPEHVLNLARTEIRVRRLRGEDVSVEEYKQRFPQLRPSSANLF